MDPLGVVCLALGTLIIGVLAGDFLSWRRAQKKLEALREDTDAFVNASASGVERLATEKRELQAKYDEAIDLLDDAVDEIIACRNHQAACSLCERADVALRSAGRW